MDSLSPEEFIILQDDMCHIVSETNNQIAILPSTLFLTNKKLLVKTIYDKVNTHFINIADIDSFEQTEVNDCNVLKMIGRDPKNTLGIFFTDPDHQKTFAELLSKLLETQQIGQAQFDALALGIQRRVRECGDVNKFYVEYHTIKDNIINEPPPQVVEQVNENAVKLLSHFQGVSSQTIDALNDMISRSETLFFATFVGLILIFNLLLILVPFGLFVSATVFILILNRGIKLLFSKDAKNIKQKMKELDQQLRKRFKKILGSFEVFKSSFDRRLLWKNPRQTLEVELFLFSIALMFYNFDSAFVLATSMFGLGFVERWDPFGFGSLYEILAELFTFSH